MRTAPSSPSTAPALPFALITALVIAGCASQPASRPNPPPPAKAAVNPFQARIKARSYHLRLAAWGRPAASSQRTASAVLTIARRRDEVCWRFTAMRGVTTPLFADVHRGSGGAPGPVVIQLGTTFRPSGCVTGVAPAMLTAIENRPAGYYLTVADRAHPLGAIRAHL